MAKNRKPAEPSGPSPEKAPKKRATVAVHLWLRPELHEALGAYLESRRPVPSLTSAVTLALQEFLEREGFWPPPAP